MLEGAQRCICINYLLPGFTTVIQTALELSKIQCDLYCRICGKFQEYTRSLHYTTYTGYYVTEKEEKGSTNE